MTSPVRLAQDFDPSIWSFERLRGVVAAVDPACSEEELVAVEGLRLYQDERLSIHYAPFDHVNEHARVVLMGITPGRRQFWEAVCAASAAIRRGESDQRVLWIAKTTGSFAGPMRTNLVRMLNEIGLQDCLGIPDCAALFSSAAELLFSTSAISFPVFVRGTNYTGQSPRILRHPLLRGIAEKVFLERVRQVSKALIIPLGKAAEEVVEHFSLEGKLERSRVLVGFPHPSGGNGHRVRLFRQQQDALRAGVEGWFSRAL